MSPTNLMCHTLQEGTPVSSFEITFPATGSSAGQPLETPREHLFHTKISLTLSRELAEQITRAPQHCTCRLEVLPSYVAFFPAKRTAPG